MIGVIPNPTKTITLNQPLELVKEVVRDLDLATKVIGKDGYLKHRADEFLNIYTFQKTELLSLGVLINITLQGDDQTTQVHIELERVIGAWDKWYEVQRANGHIKVVLEAISFGLDPDKEQRLPQIQEAREKEEKDSATGTILLMAFGVVFFLWLVA